MRKTTKIDAVIDRARQASEALLQAPEGGLGGQRVASARWIMELGERFLRQLPPREPTAPALEEEGRIKFGAQFPKARTIYNHYRGLHGVWQEAYAGIISISAIPSKGAVESLNRSLEPGMLLDAGTVERIKVGEERIRSLTVETNRLREIIRKGVPAPPVEAPSLLPPASAAPVMPETSLLREWLTAIERSTSGFEVDDIGLRATRMAGPAPRIMPAAVLKTLRSLAGLEQEQGGTLPPRRDRPAV